MTPYFLIFYVPFFDLFQFVVQVGQDSYAIQVRFVGSSALSRTFGKIDLFFDLVLYLVGDRERLSHVLKVNRYSPQNSPRA
jgi:hypothetical protein